MNYASHPIFSRLYSPYRLAPLQTPPSSETMANETVAQDVQSEPINQSSIVIEPAVIIDLPNFPGARYTNVNQVTHSEQGPTTQTPDSEKTAQSQGTTQDSKTSENQGAESSQNTDQFAKRGLDGKPLSKGEVMLITKLRSRDEEVRAHETAHVAAGAGLTSMPTYAYQVGPDGKRYAVGGSVNIDTTPEDSPEATIAKAEKIQRAALAPANPSSQDRVVAAKAKQMLTKARMELAEKRKKEMEEAGTNNPSQSITNQRKNVKDQITTASSSRLSPKATTQGSRTSFSQTGVQSTVEGSSTPISATRIGPTQSTQGSRTNFTFSGNSNTILNSPTFDAKLFPSLLAQSDKP